MPRENLGEFTSSRWNLDAMADKGRVNEDISLYI